MKKLLRNIALLLLPIMLYYVLFFIFEPSNYFGLREKTPSGDIVAMMRQYKREPVTSVIIGDSRMAHLDAELVQQIAGRPFGNLAFGGATLRENLDMLDIYIETNPQIDEVIFELSFYTVNINYDAGGNDKRIKSALRSLNNPFAYATSLYFNLATWIRASDAINGRELDGGENETSEPKTWQWVDYIQKTSGKTVKLRDNIVQYLSDISEYTENWQVNEAQIERLLKTIESCTEKGIRFAVVLPPMHPAIYEMALVPNGIEEKMLPVLEKLKKSNALLLDYEFAMPPQYVEEMYFDGLHLDYVRGLPVWTKELFTEVR